MTSPRHMSRAFPVLEGARPFAIAHRGSRILWPENTMVAFQGAVSLGYTWLETDIHLTANGVVVCLHDHTLDRTTSATGPVAGRTFAELADVDAGHHHAPEEGHPFRGAGAVIPSLEEVVTTYPDVSVVVDLKCDGTEGPLARLVDRLSLWDRLVVGSFSDARIRRFRALTGGRVATSTGPRATLVRWAASGVRLRPPAAHALQVPITYGRLRVITRRSVAAHRSAGSQVHVWTVNERPLMEQLLEWGVDGIITDRPDLLRTVMMERGAWTGRPHGV
ncbi:MAG: glycerophosphodiester phosphodiesterase [Acidimicrobiia bacterium]